MIAGSNRREFITLLGGAAAAWPVAARAQPGKLPTIGFLGGASALTESQWATAFVQRLHQLGWNEGTHRALRGNCLRIQSGEG